MASGGGSNLGAILDACRSDRIAAEVVVVISDKPGARALTRAADVGIPALPIPPGPGETRESHGERLLAALDPFDADLVVLAGYMRILSTDFVQGSADGWSTSTPRCCRATKACTPTAARSRPGNPSTAARSIT
jgi:folate-dependent phosphoribosylglycinamide formyltransferase PurN